LGQHLLGILPTDTLTRFADMESTLTCSERRLPGPDQSYQVEGTIDLNKNPSNKDNDDETRNSSRTPPAESSTIPDSSSHPMAGNNPVPTSQLVTNTVTPQGLDCVRTRVTQEQTPFVNGTDGVWLFEAIRDRHNGSYCLKWEGFSDSDNSWEERQNTDPEMRREFDAKFDGLHVEMDLVDDIYGPEQWRYKAKWLGNGAPKTCWLNQDQISPERIRKYWEKKPSGYETKQRLRYKKRSILEKRKMRKTGHKRTSNVRTATQSRRIGRSENSTPRKVQSSRPGGSRASCELLERKTSPQNI
jgi:hypothetical protein